MPNFKLTELPTISSVDFDSNDLFYVVDVQTDESKSIPYSSLAGNNINTLSSYTIQNTSNVVFLSSVIQNNATNIAANTTGEAALAVKIDGLSGSIDENTTDLLNISSIAVNNTVGELASDVLTVSGGLFALSAQVQEQEDNTTVQTIVGGVTARQPLYLPLSGANVTGPVFMESPENGTGGSVTNSNFVLEVSGGIGANVIFGREEYDALFLYSDPDGTANSADSLGGSRITLHANDAVGPGGNPVPYQIYYDAFFHNFRSVSGGNVFTVNSTTSGVDIRGALTKGSGSFKINHPLPSKSSTHNLVHSFIEGPQADNIYRGKVNLVSGSATINLDTTAGMTEGTFVLLNRNIQSYSSNESGFTPVKSSVTGNILTITSQDNSSTDTISWMVIGERQDANIYESTLTDNDGKIIVEPPLSAEPGPFESLTPNF